MQRVEYYSNFYEKFSDDVSAQVRRETFEDEDIGQNSWLTASEFRRFLSRLNLQAGHHVLEVACGSGGPDLFLADTFGCRVTGIDNNPDGIATARRLAAAAGLNGRVQFQIGDANQPLPFEAETFDALVCIDAINHLVDRARVLQDWQRVLKPGARLLFIDPIVVTGAISNEEMATRSSIGFFLFVPPGETEKLLEQAGLRLVLREDVSENPAQIAGRWHAVREQHRDQLLALEGQTRFDGMQSFFSVVHRLASERRLSRIAYIAEKPQAESLHGHGRESKSVS